MRPRAAAALRENDELLRTFKQIATLQRIDVKAPPDSATDFAGGAQRTSGACACLASGWERAAPAPGRAPGEARYGVNLTVITSPSAIA